MANSTVASPMRAGASLRKTNKPLMEKRRRARINDSLSQLKSLVITGNKKDSSQFNKLEKADILELTVKHLRTLQTHQQQQQQMNGTDPAGTPRYQDGFMECANEVIRYLSQAPGFSDDAKCRVINHLASCLQLANNKDKAMQANALAAQPAAAMNTNVTPTATVLNGGLIAASTAGVPAQGQIIQIVSGPPPAVAPPTGKPQNVHILPSPPTATVIGSNNIAMAAPHGTPSGRPSISVPGQQLAASHYSQPLHIHIPPAFSPVLVGKAENVAAVTGTRQPPKQLQQVQQQQQQQKQQQQQQQPMDIVPSQTCPEQSPIRSASSAMSTGAFQHANKVQRLSAECSVMTITRESTPSPKTRLPSSPVNSRQHQQQLQHQLDTPITHVHKIHGFYSSAEDFVPSRPRTFSMASSSSSSSSSSSVAENELPSPLNLSSQSPTSCSAQPRAVGSGVESAPKPRHFMDKNNNINNSSCYNNNNNNNKNISSYSSDQENMNMNISGSAHFSSTYRLGSYSPSSQPFSSVMLNSRGKPCSDGDNAGPALKYMSLMMEEDRQCTRNHGHRSRSTSPASSVGEDRLWRPW
ncbi:transcription factor HES-1-like [Elysia marginata]|uniref:Transcription factor HES-1-like n=1 Tax=Elysia marginata TaxID=1093978 RepID=A0AAV4I7M6_9GAST|nr:transcription factor HES-1-like [Elysia marginata]